MMTWLETILGGEPEKIETLQPEASFRSFYRVYRNGRSMVVMDAPPDKEDPARFIKLAGLFAASGVPVPTILAADVGQGFVLMDDLGRRHFVDTYLSGDAQSAIETGISMLHTLQQVPIEAVPPYTRARLADELDLFSQWFLSGLLNTSVAADWASLRQSLIDDLSSQPTVVVHRDYHCKNLLLSASGRLGIVDFQDALAGPALYDVASLLRDCYWRFEEPVIRRGLAGYLEHCPWQFSDPWHQLNRTALQRQLKAIGIFARLHLRDGKSSHLRYIEPVLDHAAFLIRESSAFPALGSWLDDLNGQTKTRISHLLAPAE